MRHLKKALRSPGFSKVDRARIPITTGNSLPGPNRFKQKHLPDNDKIRLLFVGEP